VRADDVEEMDARMISTDIVSVLQAGMLLQHLCGVADARRLWRRKFTAADGTLMTHMLLNWFTRNISWTLTTLCLVLSEWLIYIMDNSLDI